MTRTWLITGSSAGFGQAVAAAALAAGDNVIATARRPEVLHDLVAQAPDRVSTAGFGAYCAAKFALEGLSDALAAEVEPYGIRVHVVEPGAFATSFGGGQAQVSPDCGHYDETVGPQRAAVAGMDGSQPGDPALAAAAILQALDEPTPPCRLALGADAVENIGAALDGRRAELDRWADLSRSTSR